MKFKLKIFLTIITACFIILASTSNSYAVLQSNGGTPVKKDLDSWIVAIRQMEANGGTLGLNETINTTGLLPTEQSGSNGLDCHMEKNTEYGAIVLLAASSYGNQSKIESGGTTTGNVTGIVMNINKEWVAAGIGLDDTAYCKNANSRYINNDYGSGKLHIGDAMAQGGWHGNGAMTWFTWPTNSALLRAYSSSVFSYYGDAYGDAIFKNSWPSRAILVMGEGL